MKFFRVVFLLFVALLLLSTGASGNLCAQTHTAQNDSMVAQGWTFVRSFDSVDNNSFGTNITSYGDTTIFEYDFFLWQDSSVWPYSFDGGKTIVGWMARRPYGDVQYMFRSDPIDLILRPDSLFPGGSTGDNDILISTDFGKTYIKRYVDTSQFGFQQPTYCGAAWIDPTDNGTMYLQYGSKQQLYPHDFRGRYIIRTMDTGKTWNLLSLPMSAFDGAGIVTREMLMDVRQHGLWYTMVGDDISGEMNWYKTTDNGATFETWNGLTGDVGTAQAGIGYQGEIRKPWGPTFAENGARGIQRWNGEDPNNIQIFDWADSLVPGRPDTIQNTDYSGYGMGYFFAPEDPEVLLVEVGQRYYDSTTYNVFDSAWWFYSSDGGMTFRNILKDTGASKWEDTSGIITKLFLDRRDQFRVWATVNELGGARISDVYMREMPQSQSAINTKPPVNDFVIQRNSLGMELSGLPENSASIAIYDIAGRRVYANSFHCGCATERVDLPSELAQGFYFLSVLSKDGRVLQVEPFVLRE